MTTWRRILLRSQEKPKSTARYVILCEKRRPLSVIPELGPRLKKKRFRENNIPVDSFTQQILVILMIKRQPKFKTAGGMETVALI